LISEEKIKTKEGQSIHESKSGYSLVNSGCWPLNPSSSTMKQNSSAKNHQLIWRAIVYNSKI